MVVETNVNNAYLVSKVESCDFLPEKCYKGSSDPVFIIETGTCLKMFWGN